MPSIDHSGEGDAGRLAASCLGEEIIVLREQGPSSGRGPIQQRRVVERTGPILVVVSTSTPRNRSPRAMEHGTW
jgi:hypothetical protein